jgi:hypothetical protein
LAVIAAQGDALVAVHAGECGAVFHQGDDGAVALDQQHVAHVAGVLKGRPHGRLGPPADGLGRGTRKRLAKAHRGRANLLGDVGRWQGLVGKAALVAAGHPDSIARTGSHPSASPGRGPGF